VRSVGSEILSIALVLAIPLGIVASFPFAVFGFRAAEPVHRPDRTAFVSMTPEVERQALRAVRASWREKVGSARRMRAELFCAELPEEDHRSVLSPRDRSQPPVPPMAECGRIPFLPSQQAPAPLQLAPTVESDALAFPREELLKIN